MTVVGSRRSKLLLGALPVLLVLGVVGSWAWKTERHRREVAEVRQAASRRENVASLLRLSVADPLSAEERERLDRAGNNPDDVHRALVEIHELRLAYARRDLESAQAQRAALPDSRVPAERANAVRQREQVVAAQVARYADALSKLQSWQPGSAGQDVQLADAADSADRADGAASGQDRDAAGLQAAPAGPTEGNAADVMPAPSDADVAEAAKHPTMTVYPDGAAANAPAAAAVPPVAPAQSVVPAQAVAPDRARDQAEIRATLQRWAHAMMLNDPRAETAEYSPHMERYFLYRDVDRSFVEADKAAYLRKGNITARFTVENVHFDSQTPDSADVSLVKDVAWQRSRDGSTRKLIRSHLHLVRTGQGWKIAGEQDFR